MNFPSHSFLFLSEAKQVNQIQSFDLNCVNNHYFQIIDVHYYKSNEFELPKPVEISETVNK